MRITMLKYLAAGCALAALAQPAEAQRRGNWGGYRGGGWGSGYNSGWSIGYNNRWGWYGSYGSPYSYYGRGYSPYYSYGYRYPYTYGYYGYPSYSYGYSYPSYSYGYSNPGYTSSYPQQSYVTNDNIAQSQSTTSAYGDANTVQSWLRVIMPDPFAKLTIQDQPMQQTGIEREFYSTPLERGRTYVYTLRATWMENGREVTRERKVDLVAGQNTIVNFNDRADTHTIPNQMPARDTVPNPPKPTTTVEGPLTGEVVRIEGDQIYLTESRGGQERSFRLAPDGKLTINGQRGELRSITPGMRVTVTPQPNSNTVAASIEAMPRQ